MLYAIQTNVEVKITICNFYTEHAIKNV